MVVRGPFTFQGFSPLEEFSSNYACAAEGCPGNQELGLFPTFHGGSNLIFTRSIPNLIENAIIYLN